MRKKIGQPGLKKAMNKTIIATVMIFVSVCFLACREPFEPQLPFQETNFLVVEGFVNVGGGVTTIHLTRTAQLEEKDLIVYETNASVSIEDDINNHFALTHMGDGIYKSANLNLPEDRQYRIRIITSNDKVYLSAFTTPIAAPEIDSIYWQWSPTDLKIFASTHDGPDKLTYYQWDFEETWEIHSEYRTLFSYEGSGNFKARPSNEIDSLFRCWKYEYPDRHYIGSTAPLIPGAPLAILLRDVPYGDERMGYKYRILVKQHALTREHYEYLERMDKNTGQVGSFFDPQPAELLGNITAVDSPEEPVVGFVGAYVTTEKEMFIYPHELPSWDRDFSCFETEVANNPDSLNFYFVQLGWLPTRGATFQFPILNPITYYGSPPFCTDCHVSGGSSNKPDFWDN